MYYWTSDTHFDHANIIKYCARPFSNVEEMNEILIDRWNFRVNSEDTVYHLGDFQLGKKERISEILSRLKGHKILIKGNHDRSMLAMHKLGFDAVFESLVSIIDGHQIFMSHNPDMQPSYRFIGKYIRLCGHVHEKWKRKDDTINVGVDQWNFTPRTLAELLRA